MQITIQTDCGQILCTFNVNHKPPFSPTQLNELGQNLGPFLEICIAKESQYNKWAKRKCKCSKRSETMILMNTHTSQCPVLDSNSFTFKPPKHLTAFYNEHFNK